jgi:hypothetical protein
VDLRSLAPHFYGLGARILELFEEEEMVEVLSDVSALHSLSFFGFLKGFVGSKQCPPIDVQETSCGDRRPRTQPPRSIRGECRIPSRLGRDGETTYVWLPYSGFPPGLGYQTLIFLFGDSVSSGTRQRKEYEELDGGDEKEMMGDFVWQVRTNGSAGLLLGVEGRGID